MNPLKRKKILRLRRSLKRNAAAKAPEAPLVEEPVVKEEAPKVSLKEKDDSAVEKEAPKKASYAKRKGRRSPVNLRKKSE
tara:strand:- start:570 stop:809 length:240 start_codon:yes stop_codon:yes gene_type:complete